MEFNSCRASALAAWDVYVLALRHTHQAGCQSAHNGRCLPISAARAHGVTDIYSRNWQLFSRIWKRKSDLTCLHSAVVLKWDAFLKRFS